MAESKYADEEGGVEESKFGPGSDCDGEELDDIDHGGADDKHAESKATETALLARATSYCFSADFIGVFETYIEKHAHVFFDTVESGDEEHKLEYHDIFKEYLELYESTMEGWLKEEGISMKEFNVAMQKAKDGAKISEKYFIKLLIASGEYDCFYEVMIKEAERQLEQQR